MENNKDPLVNLTLICLTAIICVILASAIYTARSIPAPVNQPALVQPNQQLNHRCEQAKHIIAGALNDKDKYNDAIVLCRKYINANADDWQLVHHFYILQELNSIETLENYLTSADPRQQLLAIRSLGRLKNSGSIEKLQKLLSDNTTVVLKYQLPATPMDTYTPGLKNLESTISSAAQNALARINDTPK